MKKFSPLGNLSPSRFLKEYWHRKPLLIRQAFPGFHAPLARDELFAAASSDEIESRLITRKNGRWHLSHGPHSVLPSPATKNWTVLLQGMNLHCRALDDLLREFRFIPDARLDDLMISYASDGGGVGPHFDSYDVFLLQAQGRRHWKIGTQPNLDLVEGLPLKILKHFEPEQEFVLEPGDMLYLPPHVAHDGIAIGECMTYSIGFRAPTYQELAEGFLQFLSETMEISGRYADPGLAPTRHPAQIGNPMIAAIAARLSAIRFSQHDLKTFLGEYLSEPKPSVFFRPPSKKLGPAAFGRRIAGSGLRLSAKTRMLYAGSRLFVNGEGFQMSKADQAWLRRLANERRLEGEIACGASPDVAETLYAWYCCGWLEPGS
jgi:50S ribosomal protein L16 3-hydroxylase